jgi:hypothetical protein
VFWVWAPSPPGSWPHRGRCWAAQLPSEKPLPRFRFPRQATTGKSGRDTTATLGTTATVGLVPHGVTTEARRPTVARAPVETVAHAPVATVAHAPVATASNPIAVHVQTVAAVQTAALAMRGAVDLSRA